MLEKHALMILGKRMSALPRSPAAAAAAVHIEGSSKRATIAHSSSGRCANVLPVIKAGMHSLQVGEGGEEELVFFSYLIKTGGYIAAELSSLLQECASVILQHRVPDHDRELRDCGATEGITVISPFLTE